MSDNTAFRRAGAPGAALTYTILLRDFVATVSVAGWPGRPQARLNLELTVAHPGRGFPDDIAAVMSYEDIVEDLRRLCADETMPGPEYLAERTAALCLAHPKVRRVRVDVELPSQQPDTAAAGVSLTRTRSDEG